MLRFMLYFASSLVLLAVVTMSQAEPPIDPLDAWIETPFAIPVIDRGGAGAWDNYAVDNPFVYVDDGVYYAFYEAQDLPFASGGHERIGLAVSNDGTNWSKITVENALIDVGAVGQFDENIAKLPSGVVKRDGWYYLYYTGFNTAGTSALGLAVASDPSGNWTKVGSVLQSQPGQWDNVITGYPASVQEIDGQYRMIYRGMTSRYNNQAIGLAVSTDLLNWTRHPDAQTQPLTDPDEDIASIAVCKTAGTFVGISQPMNLANRAYWYSDDLIDWQKGEPVFINSSAQASTLSNPFLVGDQWSILYEGDDRIYQAFLGQSQTPDPVQIAHWSFDSDLSDSVGGHDGTAVRGTMITNEPDLPQIGDGALMFDKNRSQYVTIDSLAGELSTLDPFTMTLWFNTTRDGATMVHNGDNVFFSAHDASGNTNLLRIGTGVNGGIYLNPTDIGGPEPDEENGSGMNDGEWHFLAMTLETDGTTTVYVDVDGTLEEIEGFTDRPGQPKWSMAGLVSFGQEWDGATPSNFYDGLIDDVEIWKGLLTLEDLQAVLDAAGEVTQPIPGDANGDGYVDVSDLGILATNYGAGGGFGWGDGDFTGDGFVDVSDLGILATNYGFGTSALANVPSPSTITLLLCALASMLCLKRYK